MFYLFVILLRCWLDVPASRLQFRRPLACVHNKAMAWNAQVFTQWHLPRSNAAAAKSLPPSCAQRMVSNPTLRLSWASQRNLHHIHGVTATGNDHASRGACPQPTKPYAAACTGCRCHIAVFFGHQVVLEQLLSTVNIASADDYVQRGH